MAKPPRDHTAGGSNTFFLTAKTWQNRALFQSETLAELFLEVLYDYRRLEIWQRGYVDHRVRDADDYVRHRAYIQQNPVHARLVNLPNEYRYSSAHGGLELDLPPQGLKPL